MLSHSDHSSERSFNQTRNRHSVAGRVLGSEAAVSNYVPGPGSIPSSRLRRRSTREEPVICSAWNSYHGGSWRQRILTPQPQGGQNGHPSVLNLCSIAPSQSMSTDRRTLFGACARTHAFPMRRRGVAVSAFLLFVLFRCCALAVPWGPGEHRAAPASPSLSLRLVACARPSREGMSRDRPLCSPTGAAHAGTGRR